MTLHSSAASKGRSLISMAVWLPAGLLLACSAEGDDTGPGSLFSGPEVDGGATVDGASAASGGAGAGASAGAGGAAAGGAGGMVGTGASAGGGAFGADAGSAGSEAGSSVPSGPLHACEHLELCCHAMIRSSQADERDACLLAASESSADVCDALQATYCSGDPCGDLDNCCGEWSLGSDERSACRDIERAGDDAPCLGALPEFCPAP